MTFDPCPHMIKLIIIRCGQVMEPEEKNITTLYNKYTEILGVPPIVTTTQTAPKSPSPSEMQQTGQIPKRICPKCEKQEMVMFGLCATCEDSEGGKYKTKWVCEMCGYSEKSEKPILNWLNEMGMEFSGMKSKKEMGIKTITDEGVK